MKTWRLLMGAAVAATGLMVACTSDPIKDTDDEGTGASGGTGTTTTMAGPTTTTMSGPGPTSTTTTGMQMTDVCGSGATFGNPFLDQCYTDNCCPQFDACLADADCGSCLAGTGTDCDNNALYQAWGVCADDNCPTSVCDSDIGFINQQTMEPIFDCNGCINDNCCTQFDACINFGGVDNTVPCLDCVNAKLANQACPGGTDPGLEAAATGFADCLLGNCTAECGG